MLGSPGGCREGQSGRCRSQTALGGAGESGTPAAKAGGGGGACRSRAAPSSPDRSWPAAAAGALSPPPPAAPAPSCRPRPGPPRPAFPPPPLCARRASASPVPGCRGDPPSPLRPGPPGCRAPLLQHPPRQGSPSWGCVRARPGRCSRHRDAAPAPAERRVGCADGASLRPAGRAAWLSPGRHRGAPWNGSLWSRDGAKGTRARSGRDQSALEAFCRAPWSRLLSASGRKGGGRALLARGRQGDPTESLDSWLRR